MVNINFFTNSWNNLYNKKFNRKFGFSKQITESLSIPKTKRVFGRDTIPYMKPSTRSFKFVNNEIIKDYNKNNEIYFFDDMVENLITANRIGWKTVWISSNFINKQNFIDYAFPNIYEAILYFKLKESIRN